MMTARCHAGIPATILACTLAALALGSTGCGAPGNAESETKENPEIPINVRVLDIVTRDFDEFVVVTGPLVPRRGTNLSAEETGRVASIPRDKGADIQRGQAVLVLDRALLETEMKAAAANLKLVEYDESRLRTLFEEKQISRYEMLTKETELAQARATADASRIRWERAAVRAPFDGIVADRWVEPGQLVAPGTPVCRVVDPYTLKMRASVSEREISWIRDGADAVVTLAGLELTVSGRVTWVSFEADPANGKFQVEIEVPNPDLGVRPGVVGRAEIHKQAYADVVVIPRDAVVPQPTGDAVFVVDNERAMLRSVTLGPDQGLLTTVTHGLASSDRLIVRGQRDVLDGSLVRVTEVSDAVDGSLDSDPGLVKAAESFAPVEIVPEEGTSR